MKEFRGYIRYLLPITLYAHTKDIKNTFYLNNTNKKNPHIDPSTSIALSLDRIHTDNEKVNIMQEIIKNKLNDDMGVYINVNDLKRLRCNEPLFLSVKSYLHDFLAQIQKTTDQTEAMMMKESEVLEYFKNNTALVYKFFDIFEKDFSHLKQYSPHIIDSWTYYKQFIKLKKDLG